MELFEIKEDQIVFSPTALMLMPFRALWTRDKSKGKMVANSELAAVYYFTDYKSDFSTMLDDLEKLALIKTVIVGMDPNWTPDQLFKDACTFYARMQETHATLLLQDAQYAVASVRKFLRNLDMEEEINGKPKHDIKKVIDSLGSLNNVTESLFKLQEQVKKQIQSKNEVLRGGKEKAIFEDGIE